MADRMALAADERRDLADFLDSLAPTDWHQPTLCTEWSVRDVVAHVISYEELGWVGLAGAFAKGRFKPGKVNDVRVDEYRNRPPEELISILRANLRPHGLTAGFGGGIGLSDSLIHHQDIRRALGRPRDVPGDRVVEALDISLKAPVLPSKKNAAGLRLAPTDLDWTHGDGPEVTGPAEAILMACAGRVAALDDLGGEGLHALRERVSTPD